MRKHGVPHATPIERRVGDDDANDDTILEWKLARSVHFTYGGCELLYYHEESGAQLLIEATKRKQWRTFADPKTGATFDTEEGLIDFLALKQADNSAIGIINRLRKKLIVRGLDPDGPDPIE